MYRLFVLTVILATYFHLPSAFAEKKSGSCSDEGNIKSLAGCSTTDECDSNDPRCKNKCSVMVGGGTEAKNITCSCSQDLREPKNNSRITRTDEHTYHCEEEVSDVDPQGVVNRFARYWETESIHTVEDRTASNPSKEDARIPVYCPGNCYELLTSKFTYLHYARTNGITANGDPIPNKLLIEAIENNYYYRQSKYRKSKVTGRESKHTVGNRDQRTISHQYDDQGRKIDTITVTLDDQLEFFDMKDSAKDVLKSSSITFKDSGPSVNPSPVSLELNFQRHDWDLAGNFTFEGSYKDNNENILANTNSTKSEMARFTDQLNSINRDYLTSPWRVEELANFFKAMARDDENEEN